MADLWEDGVRVAQSEKANFTTLSCGSMTLTYDYYRRPNCSDHNVVYNYTSTYAATSCVLHVAGPNGFAANYQGVIDSNAGTVTFTATDWEGGEGYTFNATLYDIYGEELTSATTSITSATMNVIALTPTAATETTVTLGISKCNDCGFFNGWVDVWLGTKDPDTDPSDFHEYFNETDTSITISGLTANTSYYFRATFYCDDTQTQVVSAAVSYSTTAHEYGYFCLENAYNGTNTFALTKTGTPTTNDLAYSLDGNTWVAFGLNTETETVSIPQNGKIYLRSSTGLNKDGYNYVKFSMSRQHTASGHVASLFDYTNMGSCTSIPQKSFWHLLEGDENLINASGVDFYGITSIETLGCYLMFNACTRLTAAPNLSDVTSIAQEGCSNMFTGCNSLANTPNMSKLTTVGNYGCYQMFKDCTSMLSTPNLGNVTSIGNRGCREMFSGCTSLTTATGFGKLTSIPDQGCADMFYNCISLTAIPDLSKVTSIGGNGCVGMFQNCQSLTTGADLSKVTTVNNYGCTNMYNYCTSITTVYAPKVSSWNTDNFKFWLANVSASGVVYKPSALSIPSGGDGVPNGWTTQNY